MPSSTLRRPLPSTGRRAPPGESTAARPLVRHHGDRRYRVPAMRLAELHAAHTPDTYAYLFTWQSPAWNGQLGAAMWSRCRSCSARSMRPMPRIWSPPGRRGDLTARMQYAWAAFARTGSPQTPALPDWEPYTVPRRRTMLLGTSCGFVDAPREEERHFWASRAVG